MTFDNWVTKTVNFLRLEADVDVGDTIGLALPLHWMSAVWLVAVWEAGAHVSFGDADLTVATEGDPDVLVVADPFGMAAPPVGTQAEWNFPADVRAMPDQLVLPAPPMGAMAGGPVATDLLAEAASYARDVGLVAGGRLLTNLPVRDLSGTLATIAGAIAVDAAVVYADSSGQEQTTAVAH